MNLNNAVIAITGGAGGLGLAMAKRLGAAGAKLALIDRAETMLVKAQQELAALNIHSIAYTLDICDEKAVEKTFQKIPTDFGQLNGLVNNAGLAGGALLVTVENGKTVGKISMADWQRLIDVNLTGSFLCGREAASIMACAGKGGCIVNISSVAAAGSPGQSQYSASKAGVLALTVVWSKDLAPYGIRCAAVSPGMADTAILGDINPQMLEESYKAIPAHRMATPDEIAAGVEFIFCNDYFNGRTLAIDGGLRV